MKTVATKREDLRIGDKILYLGFDGNKHVGEVAEYSGRIMQKNAGYTGYSTLPEVVDVIKVTKGV